jgi:aldehyde:ferredoxin oxidoreductase
MEGYMGTLLRVNLTDGRIRKEPLNKTLAQEFVGGRGFNSKMLYDELTPGIDPLGPENKIIVGAGPCAGTIVPGSSRFTISAKSPLTGFLGDSNAGGFFGVGLKYAGYDAVIIEGRSDRPVYLFIDDDRVELRDAERHWGRSALATTRAIQKENFDPGIYVISIGPAGENQVRFGNLMTDLGRAAGRTGQGAVFGSKNLKAVAVRGRKGVRVAHPAALMEAVGEMYQAWTAPSGKGGGLNLSAELRARYGPAAGWARYQNFGMFGTKNFQGGASWKSQMEGIDRYFVKQKACFACPAGCDHLFVIPDGPYAGAYGGGMELTILDFGPNIGNEDQALNVKLHELCDQYGLDYMDTRSCLGFAMECFEKGVLKDTDGLDLRWGSAETALELVAKIARREGLGAVLAEGVMRAAETMGQGAQAYAMQVKGQALVARDPRASKGWGLAYAVSGRGACHVRAHIPEAYDPTAWDASLQEIFKKYQDPTNPLREEGKAELVKWHEDMQAFKNSMEICLFIIYPWTVPGGCVPRMLARLHEAVTGNPLDEQGLLKIGERIVNLERCFNIREGLTRRDDALPERFLKEPYPDGPAKGEVVRLEPMIDEYYAFRGWDRATGFPTREKLAELHLTPPV